MNSKNLHGFAVYVYQDMPCYWRTDEMQPDDWEKFDFDSIWPTHQAAAQRCRELSNA